MSGADPAGPAPIRPWLRHGPVRGSILALLLLGVLALLVELTLLEHTESAWQWTPFPVLGLGLASLLTVTLRPGRGTIRAFRGTMVLFVATGLVGLWLHFRGNRTFELEMDPAARGLALVWASLHGATPALAPGALVQMGLLGLVATLRHPYLRTSRAPSSIDEDIQHREDP